MPSKVVLKRNEKRPKDSVATVAPAPVSFWKKRWRLIALLSICIGLLAFGFRPALRQYLILNAKRAIESRQDQDALRMLTQAQKYTGRSGEIDFYRARVYRHLGQGELMREHLQNAQQLGYPLQRIEREWALAQAESGILGPVEKQLTDWLADPGEDEAEICSALARGFSINFRFDEAAAILNAWQMDLPNDPEAFSLAGQFWQARQDQTRAEEQYEKAIAVSPTHKKSLLGLAQAKLSLSKVNEAETLYRTYLELEPSNLPAQLGLSDALAKAGKFDEACEVLEKLVKEDPNRSEPVKLLGQLKLESGDLEGAIRVLEPMAQKWPLDTDVNYVLGRCYTQLGQPDKAKPFIAKTEEAQLKLDRIEQLILLTAEKPQDANVRLELGQLMMEYRSRTDGLGYLQSAVLLDPNLTAAHEALASYYERIGDRPNTERHRRIVQQLTAVRPVNAPAKAPTP